MTAFFEKIQVWVADNGASFIRNLVVAIIVVLVGKLLIGRICGLVKASLDKSGRVSELLTSFMVNVLEKVLWVFLFLIAMDQVGIEVAPLIAGLGVGGFIIGFAFQESLGNLAAGLMIALNRPFKIGDVIEAGGQLGKVGEMNMMAVTLTTGDNRRVVIPNRGIWGSAITNYTALETRRVDLVVGIAYGADINKAKTVILDVIKGLPTALDDPAPVCEVTAMADSSVNLIVRVWCKTADFWTVTWAANHAIKEALDRNGIEIPFPQLDVHHHGWGGNA